MVVIAAVLLAGFIALVGSALVRGIDTSCGCFGSLSRRADLGLVAMDAVLLLMAVSVFAVSGPPGKAASGRPLPR